MNHNLVTNKEHGYKVISVYSSCGNFQNCTKQSAEIIFNTQEELLHHLQFAVVLVWGRGEEGGAWQNNLVGLVQSY